MPLESKVREVENPVVLDTIMRPKAAASEVTAAQTR
jgi:hypothetical protein